ncbi:MAG: hypothetical protein KC591_16615 [Gemmatimonadetes bacterium]|nr:hypothetical protein [Gemmatimonadota bacterium]
MNWNPWVRQLHRWMSIVFTVLVVANIVAMVRTGGQREPDLLTYSPLLPLALLLLSGLYLFALPYLAKWRR